jgi:hypothetical protein
LVDSDSQRDAFFDQGGLPFQAIHSDNVAQGTTCRMKVFLSNSTKDKQFVEALAAEYEPDSGRMGLPATRLGQRWSSFSGV